LPITLDQLQSSINQFASMISMQPLGLIRHQPSSDALPTNCLSNAQNFQKKNGGDIRYGWYFLHRMSPEYGDYLIATHHAVWQNPENTSLIDITPFHAEEKHHPIAPGGELLFLVDDKAQPIKVENLLIPRPSYYYPIGNNPKIAEYVKNLQNNELQYYKQQYGLYLG